MHCCNNPFNFADHTSACRRQQQVLSRMARLHVNFFTCKPQFFSFGSWQIIEGFSLRNRKVRRLIVSIARHDSLNCSLNDCSLSDKSWISPPEWARTFAESRRIVLDVTDTSTSENVSRCSPKIAFFYVMTPYATHLCI